MEQDLRLKEALSLRVKDIDFTSNIILVKEGKGWKDRRTIATRKIKRRTDSSS